MIKSPALWPRIVMHADMDAYFAAVETLDNPSLANVPLIIGGRSNRSVVCTANYSARRFGIRSAMPMSRALRLCPEATVVAPRHGRYQEVSRQIMKTFRTFTDLVEPLSLDEAYLDLTTVAGHFEGPRSLGVAVKSAVYKATDGLTVSIGISTSKFVAKVASDFQKPDGLTVVDAQRVHEFIRPLDTSRLWSAGPRTVERLNALGFETIGDVADAPQEALRSLGRQGEFLHRLARGDDQRAVVPHRTAKSVGWERTLESDVESKGEILPLLRTAAKEVGRRLDTNKKSARGVRLKLKTKKFELITRQRTLLHPTRDSTILWGAAKVLLDTFELTEPVRLVGLTAYDLHHEGQPEQLLLFNHEINPERFPGKG